MSFLMSDILTTIRDLAQNELEDLGTTEATQSAAIFRLVNVVLYKRAKQANNVEWSDSLSIAANGYQTFQKSSATITDMYEPMMVYDVTAAREKTTNKRTSFDIGNGWYREADNQRIHTYGLTGNHKLQYIRYPAAVTATGNTVEFPKAGQMDIIMDVVALCKLPKNYYDEFRAVKQNATGTATVKASMDAQAKGTPLTLQDREE